MCVLIYLQLTSETLLILLRSDPDTIKMYIGLQGKYPFFVRCS